MFKKVPFLREGQKLDHIPFEYDEEKYLPLRKEDFKKESVYWQHRIHLLRDKEVKFEEKLLVAIQNEAGSFLTQTEKTELSLKGYDRGYEEGYTQGFEDSIQEQEQKDS